MDYTEFITHTPDGERMSWQDAIRELSKGNYRIIRSGAYQTMVSNFGRNKYLGTYRTPEEAEQVVYQYRADRFKSRVMEYGLCPDDGVVCAQNYVLFRNGMLFNLHGIRLYGNLHHKGGRISVALNGRIISLGRLVAAVFCRREPGEKYVSYIDGDFTNVDADNLEWSPYYDIREDKKK